MQAMNYRGVNFPPKQEQGLCGLEAPFHIYQIISIRGTPGEPPPPTHTHTQAEMRFYPYTITILGQTVHVLNVNNKNRG